MRLILASSSPYRRALLSRLGIPFQAISPNADETPMPGEAPDALAKRLSLAKARAIAMAHPEAVIIGSDQVATANGSLLGKPGTFAAAQAQLRNLSGRVAVFHSALCVIYQHHEHIDNVITRCQFRELTHAEIDTYLQRDEPFDTAGSAKAESLGIALMQSMRSDDPTAIIGLPLIALTTMLRQVGLNPLQASPLH